MVRPAGGGSGQYLVTPQAKFFLDTKALLPNSFLIMAMATLVGWQEWEEASDYTMTVARAIDNLEMPARAEATRALVLSLLDLCIQDERTRM